MAFVIKDRIYQTSTFTGTGNITLSLTALAGHQTFGAIGTGNQTDYTIISAEDGNQVEVGVCTITVGGSDITLARDSVTWSTNSNNKVDFSAGDKNIYSGPFAHRMIEKHKFPKWDVNVLNGNETLRAFESQKKGTYSEAVSTFGSLTGTLKWIGGVLSHNGMIYGIPFSATSVLKINPTNDTASTFGSLTGDIKWIGGVLAPNGMIYGIPYNSTTVLKINPTNDTVSTFGSLTETNKWWGGVLAPNGMIYGIPRSSTTVLKIDPTNDTVSTFGSLSGDVKWAGGVLASNGMIYGIPRDSTSILKIDPTNDTASVFGSLSETDKWAGGVLAPNGSIYGIPLDSTTVLKLTEWAEPLDPNFPLSRHFNKL